MTLVNAISHINIGGILSVAGVHAHEFDLTADIGVNYGYPVLNLAAGDTLTVKTAGHTFAGAVNGSGGGDFHFAATAAGGGVVLLDNAVPTFNVASSGELIHALYSMNYGPFVGMWAVPNTNYVINLTADIAWDSSIPLVNLAPNDTLTINLLGHTYNSATNGAGDSFTFASTRPAGPPCSSTIRADFQRRHGCRTCECVTVIRPGGFFYSPEETTRST